MKIQLAHLVRTIQVVDSLTRVTTFSVEARSLQRDMSDPKSSVRETLEPILRNPSSPFEKRLASEVLREFPVVNRRQP